MILVVPAYPDSPAQKAVKRLCVCVCVRACVHACVHVVGDLKSVAVSNF